MCAPSPFCFGLSLPPLLFSSATLPALFLSLSLFFLFPIYLEKLDLINQERLIANEFIQCRKVCEHVLEKVLGADLPGGGGGGGSSTGGGGNSNSSQNNSQSDANSEGSQVPAEERIELLCNDVVSFAFKYSPDLIIRSPLFFVVLF